MTTEQNKQAKVIVGFECNNNCVFCYEKTKRHLPGKTTSELKEEIAAVKKKGFTNIHFIGGEPTIRPDIIELIAFAKAQQFSNIMITTNGRMFSYLPFAREIVLAGLNQIVFSIHGHTAKIHDGLVQVPGAFEQVKKGIENISILRLKNILTPNVGVNVVITSKNYKYLQKIGEMLQSWMVERVEFIYVSALDNIYKEITPRISLAQPYVLKTIEVAKKSGYQWSINNVPMLCYFSKIKDSVGCVGGNEESFFVKNKKSELFHNMEKNKVINWRFVDKCRNCILRKECVGIQDIYLKQFGEDEVTPVI